MSRRAIVCVDDERLILRGLKEQLRRALPPRWAIETAESGDEGLELLEELAVDGIEVPVIISDQLMPGMRGDEFLARAYARDSRVLSVLLTGQASAAAVGEAVNTARLYRFIAKPWVAQDLLQTVRTAIDAWDQARATEKQAAELAAAHASSLRFVPKDFLRLVGREHLVDVLHGDHTLVDLGVMFADMRGYTRAVEGLGPEASFAFVNTWVEALEEPVHALGGFIGNLIGDAILALFPGGADAAVRAGIACHEAVAHIQSPTSHPIGLSVGVHYGPVLNGTVGARRLHTAMVGDTVNLASRVEGLTRPYGVRMLATGRVREELTLPGIRFRHVDHVRAKGRQGATRLHQVLNAEDHAPDDAAVEAFERAVSTFQAGRFAEARSAFLALADRDPDDAPSQLYLERCRRYLARPPAEPWTGVTSLDFK